MRLPNSKSIRAFFTRIGSGIKGGSKKTTGFIRQRPILSFILSLGLLFGLIVLGSMLAPKPQTPTEVESAKEVRTFNIGSVPKVVLQAKVEKNGVIKIVAQTGGIVHKINVQEGDEVKKNQKLIELSTNYQGQSAQSLQTAIANKQYQNLVESYQTQKDLIKKQREIAEKTNESSSDLRAITQQATNDAVSLVNLNEDITQTLYQNLNQYQATNSGDINRNFILQTQQMIAQFQSGINQLNSQIRNNDYQVNTNEPPAQLSNLQKEVTLKQLDIQEKALDLNKEISKLQLALAAVSESLMRPVSPSDAKVQMVHVKEGDVVTPGQTLVTLSTDDTSGTAIVKVPANIARQISIMQESTLVINNKSFNVLPSFISSEATDGQLFSAIFVLPEDSLNQISDGEYIKTELALGYPQAGSTIPFIPLDSVFQTQNESIVYIAENEKVIARKVELGSVVGSYVEIKNGLFDGDQVITDRNVLEGDQVKIKQ